MSARSKVELVDGMYVVGDQAYLPHEWAQLERERARGRAYYQRNREKRIAAAQRWQEAHPERVREIRRESARRKRLAQGGVRVTASLHDLACHGPTKPACRCRKILVVRSTASEVDA